MQSAETHCESAWTMPDVRRLDAVQAARGIAAMAVVLSHAGTVLGSSAALGYVPMRGVFRAGHAGVDFFFVLSGFIIALVHHRDIGRPHSLPAYLWKRVTRIYPIYWFALGVLALLIAFGFVRDVDPVVARTDISQLLVTLLLLPQHRSPLLGVSWTLQHEMLFYLLFGLAILNRRLGCAILTCWLLLIVGGMIWGAHGFPWAPTSLLWDFIASPYHLQFLLGIAVAAAVLADRVPLPRTLLAVGIVGITTTAALEDLDRIEYLGAIGGVLFGGFSACAIAGMAAAERKGMLSVGAMPLLFGEASYAIYLVHFQAIALMAALLIGSGFIHVMPGWLLMLALAIGGGVAGIAVHVVAERPILRWLRSVWKLHRPANDPILLPTHTREGIQHAARKTA